MSENSNYPKAGGTRSGKAFGRPRTAPEVEQRIREALATSGRPGFHKIAAQFGVAIPVVSGSDVSKHT